uniref:uncharacterized protein LOC122581539 n=1 Tax=Erigeron canadensis TaxID=72917 RepID=UPI001CB8FD1C|nr:uncharacterized protein LOC122581539 [Erigeron canadensis]
MWFDKWSVEGPLYEFISRRDLYDARLEDTLTVDKMILNGEWSWPDGWLDIFPRLANIEVPNIHFGKEDKVRWLTKTYQKVDFSTSQAWSDLRDEWPSVEWSKVIWFKQFNPRNAFILWLAVHDRLLTQDKMAIWKENADFKCVFCSVTADNHEHLFFQCAYVKSVWRELQRYMFQMQGGDRMQSVISNLARFKDSKNIGVIVNKLMVAAAVYFIWQERNARVFKNQIRNKEVLCQNIMDSVRCKMMTIKVRNTRNVQRIAELWNLNWKECRLQAK